MLFYITTFRRTLFYHNFVALWLLADCSRFASGQPISTYCPKAQGFQNTLGEGALHFGFANFTSCESFSSCVVHFRGSF